MARKCKVCREVFTPVKPMQTVCGHECALTLVKAKREKADKAAKSAERKAYCEQRAKIKTRAQWMKEAQAAVNRYIRLRDDGLPCISCGRHHQGVYHAGHYRSVGAAPELRFNELNIHKQCQPCNVHLSGNQIKYRAGLVDRIGVDRVEWLESNHPQKNYTIDDLKSIKAEYNERVKVLSGMPERQINHFGLIG